MSKIPGKKTKVEKAVEGKSNTELRATLIVALLSGITSVWAAFREESTKIEVQRLNNHGQVDAAHESAMGQIESAKKTAKAELAKASEQTKRDLLTTQMQINSGQLRQAAQDATQLQLKAADDAIAGRADSLKDKNQSALLFKELINDLVDKDKSKGALIALWTQFEPKDRDIIVAAALIGPDKDTIRSNLLALKAIPAAKSYVDRAFKLLDPETQKIVDSVYSNAAKVFQSERKQGRTMGIDISAYSFPVDWRELSRKNEIQFAFIRATENLHEDFAFKQTWKDIAGSSLVRGAYHTGFPGDGIKQASFFLNAVRPRKGDLLCLDLEIVPPDNKTMTASQAEAFCKEINLRTGNSPILYSNRSVLQSLRLTKSDYPYLTACPLWLARYANSAGTVPKPWEDWTFWQLGMANQADGDDYNEFKWAASKLKEFGAKRDYDGS